MTAGSPLPDGRREQAAERPPNRPAYYGGRAGTLYGSGRNARPIYAWTDLTLLLHRDGVSWGYDVVSGTEPDCENPAAATCASVARRASTPGI